MASYDDSKEAPGPVFVVAVAGSAGALDAFQRFFRAMPADSGFAFIVVQHLDPSRESHLAEILARETAMPVEAAKAGMPLERNHVYAMPPGLDLHLADGRFQQGSGRSPQRGAIIDGVFATLAEVAQDQAIGILLSGTGHDGTQGLAAIRAAGGLTFVQDDGSARFTEMPHSAATAGHADFVLPPEAIAQRLATLGTEGPPATPTAAGGDGREAAVQRIIAIVSKTAKVDLSHYRPSTLRRRIERRLMLSRQQTLSDYATWLENNPSEVHSLFQDLLINVTSFFRDPASFQAIQDQAFPSIARARSPDETVRFWVAGCSTGQEAYSLAIAWSEFTKAHGIALPVQVFGTDVNQAGAIDKAREGVYPATIEAEVSPNRLARFFTREGADYRIRKDLRDVCIFARHDVLRDPPFSRVDLISCRNLFIYLSPATQRKILRTFHYALKPGGLLFLGNAESVGDIAPLFDVLDAKQKIFVKKAGRPDAGPPSVAQRGAASRDTEWATPVALEAKRQAEQVVLDEYAPPGVVVDQNNEVLHFRGHIRPFLNFPRGNARFGLFDMTPEVLGLAVRELLTQARATRKAVWKRGIRFRVDHEVRTVDVRVIPLAGAQEGANCVVLFETPAATGNPPLGGASTDTPIEREAEALREEVAAAKALRDQVAERHEHATAELRALNEELLASNEELQSSNEELETSKEELRATSDELTAANQRLEAVNREEAAQRTYVENILATIREPLVVLDAHLDVLTTNPAFRQMFPHEGRNGDAKVPVEDRLLDDPDLRQLLRDVLSGGSPVENYVVKRRAGIRGTRTLILNARKVDLPERGAPLLLVVLEDLTGRVELEAVARRTAELQGIAQEAEAFGYAVSHDLRTPMRALAGFAEVLAAKYSDKFDAEGRKTLAYLVQSSGRLMAIVESLLQLSLLARTPVERQPVDVVEVANDIVADLRKRDPERNVEIVLPSRLVVKADPTLFKILLTNLFENAWKFTRERDRARVELGVEADDVEGTTTLFVRDNGIGFDAASAATLFQPFQRLPNAATFPGTGIGLATVRRIVQRHGGRIAAEGRPGEGSTIRFSLAPETIGNGHGGTKHAAKRSP